MPNNTQDPNRKTVRIRFNFSWFYILLIMGIGWLLFNNSGANPQKVEWAEVKEMFASGDIKEIDYVRNSFKGSITIRPDRISKYADKFAGKVPASSPHFFFLVSDKFDAEKEFEALNEALPRESQVKIVVENESHAWADILEWLIFPILLILMWVWMFRGFNKNMGGGPGGPGGGIFNVGKSTGKLADKEKVNVTFKDVAGLYGAKEEVMEIVDFLKNPQKYTSLGGKIPKGALLVGPPGTGKTLLAKAVAGEANVPFFSISGSDFVEMFVGVGASRVRDLFRQAKEKAPCIVFIDEIDAVGRARGKNVGFSSNDERENTLNQLLTEMDGFDTNSGVIILAATNRADILDKALMRAGRFDRQIHVELPELKEREEIFLVHMRGLKISKDFDVSFMAQHTPGFSGADIANVCNEAALTAARKGKAEIEKQDFLDAVDRIIGGLERKSSILTPQEKKTTAYHEAGHATVGWLLPYSDPVFKVSLIPRGDALGLTWYLPDERKILSKSYLMDKMCALIGGRVAEEIINGEPATGALNDLERLTRMAYNMVQFYGMSEKVGELSFYDSTGARGYDLTKPYSEKTAELMDQEVKDLVDEIHSRTMKILLDHKDGFVKMAQLLLEKEVIFAEDIEKILGPKVKPADESQEETDE
ncbi:MAG: ATP-dependent zinc metalloprotease FtsH [Bacteroidales bacterium]|nr:ATP-dependent zinc metalloprotease FtsH [Bacteroidales bacterium]